jgi:hypothetical protein
MRRLVNPLGGSSQSAGRVGPYDRGDFKRRLRFIFT